MSRSPLKGSASTWCWQGSAPVFVAFAPGFYVASARPRRFHIVVVVSFPRFCDHDRAGSSVGRSLLLFVLVDFIGYFVFCEMLFNGRTLGKRAAGLRVVRAAASPSASGPACSATCCA